jgi:hypothetical protein
MVTASWAAAAAVEMCMVMLLLLLLGVRQGPCGCAGFRVSLQALCRLRGLPATYHHFHHHLQQHPSHRWLQLIEPVRKQLKKLLSSSSFCVPALSSASEGPSKTKQKQQQKQRQQQWVVMEMGRAGMSVQSLQRPEELLVLVVVAVVLLVAQRRREGVGRSSRQASLSKERHCPQK